MFVPPLEEINKAAIPAESYARMLSDVVEKIRAV
jgi:hypothetical protein